MAESKTADKPAEKKKKERKPVKLSTGKITTDLTVEISCANADKNVDGCQKKRVIKKQDEFQVKFCISCQNLNRNKLRRDRRKKKAKSKAKAKA